ncbi:MAG TPA: 2-oxoglutarate dehydrogenase E1 component [Saprospiraceae bacterium]|nr:2-oxoglutarate dehydrogenase E1 component [Saprospiraceae bacterium]HNB31083.1 2-oxoglutarate dehydrogenase E1 component [Saprospiraceae bacterium]HNC35887.1 2-oxoglutarate dehydrogenase E1 component [Saprospiraceae bacterium]HNE63371.1 2-oxoglutarate dehydrogenase E1 component [Saprospiraceae bacterium]HNI79504.1 2-oxoglutarate dehydrogenase E1 component [Saprospiraceae bacterium]
MPVELFYFVVMKNMTFLINAHPSYIEALYLNYKSDPQSVHAEWRQFFQGFELGLLQSAPSNSQISNHDFSKADRFAMELVHSYRSRGHLEATTNPIRARKDRKARLAIVDHGFQEIDRHRKLGISPLDGLVKPTLQELESRLRSIYCDKIGFEYAHIEDLRRRDWLQQKIEIEAISPHYGLQLEEKQRILEKLNGSVIFEKFLHTKYVGQKRFSLEGGESTIAALDTMIRTGGLLGVEELVIGMAHRGRLNVLANIMGKTYEQIFSEFEGTAVPDLSFGSGDVKYHLGFSSMIEIQEGRRVFLRLAPNPSHLEAVDPVVEGLSRAKADLIYQSDYDKILPVLIHGDAAIAGQGVVYETLQMSQLNGYYTGGTIHFVINNQIGFTTDFEDARSSTYSTSVASLVQAPVFHVNGDDPEAVVFVTKLAVQYRQEFNSDVFIDMVCYRRHGHNEGDDPKFTQPKLYNSIANHPNVRDLYIQSLQQRGEIEKKLATDMETAFWNELQERLDMVKQNPLPYLYQEPELAWKELKKQAQEDPVSQSKTSIDKARMQIILDRLLSIPEGFNVLPKVGRLLKASQKLLAENQLDWALAELLAYGSILMDGMNVRMSGQDVKRGTFSHRHAVLYDEINNTEYNRLSQLADDQGKFFIYNSLLSEFAVLGFEYGYSLASPHQLVIWEAQFGDFANGAQVIVDQFIATAEVKWNRMSNLVMLLPHGYDGQGPEHSSARLERFLQATAEKNIIVANVTTPSNFFHLLRRQVKAAYRKPLIVMSPKSLLRHPACLSPEEEFTGDSGFRELIIDSSLGDCKTLIFCSGQVYYDLVSSRSERNDQYTTIIRIEQLYPFPTDQIQTLIRSIRPQHIRWVQEEPANMGAASFVKSNWPDSKIEIISRPASAATAVGYKKVHDLQIKEILERSFE